MGAYRQFPDLDSPSIGKAEEAVWTALDQFHRGWGSDQAVNAASQRLAEAELRVALREKE